MKDGGILAGGTGGACFGKVADGDIVSGVTGGGSGINGAVKEKMEIFSWVLCRRNNHTLEMILWH